MDVKIAWWKHVYYSVRFGKWSVGFMTRKTWKGKPYLGVFKCYYDGWHWCIHVGPFYLGAGDYE